MRTLLMSVAALLALGACGETSAPPPATTAEAPVPMTGPTNAAEATAADTCGAAAFQHLVGTPASAIDQATLPAGARIVTPTTMVTQDFRADRLNVTVDTNGNVASLNCY